MTLTSCTQVLDVTASIITYTQPAIVGDTVAVAFPFTYTRRGEDLTITNGTWLGIETHVRSLTLQLHLRGKDGERRRLYHYARALPALSPAGSLASQHELPTLLPRRRQMKCGVEW